MSLNKAQLSILVRNVTDHAHLDAHRKVIGDYGQYEGITQEYIDHINGLDNNICHRSSFNILNILDEVDINLATNNGTCKFWCNKGMQ